MLRNSNYVYGDQNLKVPAELNFGSYMIDTLWKNGDKIAMINGATNEKLTYRELARDAINLAVSLTFRGVKRGDTIGICSENRQEYYSTVIGISCTGAVITATNMGYTKDEHKHVLDISKPKMIFCSPTAYKTHQKMLKTLPYLKNIIVYGREVYPNTILYADLIRNRNNLSLDNFTAMDVNGQTDTAVILYSSGTTGLPKGVMMTHLNVIATCTLPSTVDPNELTLYITPWYHTMGLMGALRVFSSGYTMVYLPKFELDLYLQTIEKYKIQETLYRIHPSLQHNVYASNRLPIHIEVPTFLVSNLDPDTQPGYHWVAIHIDKNGFGQYFDSFGRLPTGFHRTFLNRNCRVWTNNSKRIQNEWTSIVQLVVAPPVLVALSKYPAKYDVSSVRLAYSGAAPLREDTIQAVKARFPNMKHVLQGYGMTEATLAITRDSYDNANISKIGGVGRIVSALVIKIVDIETREPLGPNKQGEICVKGVLIMKGYIGKDRTDDFDEEGFFKTGDIGYYDDDKYFFVVDRLKELIKYKGYQVPPAEIEEVLIQHPSIREAGVVGIPHERGGEVPIAFVVLQPDKRASEKEIKDFVAEKLSNPKHLRGGVRFVDEIPKNPSGKILRKKLRELLKRKSKL